MKHVVIFSILVVIFGVSAAVAQNDVTANDGSVSTKSQNLGKRRINIFYHLGSLELPNDFSGEVTADWNDAWAGTVRSKDGTLKIGWRAGTIQYLRETRKNDIESLRTETTGSNVYEVAELKEEVGKTIIAKIDWLEFSCKVDSEAQEDLFWSILATYEKERCTTCRSLPINSQQ